MKKLICLLLAACLLFAMAACGGNDAEPDKTPDGGKEEIRDWTRSGYFQDENGNILTVTWMDDVVDPGWYVGCMLGEDLIEDSWGGVLPQEGNALRGVLGLPQQGTITTVCDMYANRYPWEDALKLFGAMDGKGAQAIK